VMIFCDEIGRATDRAFATLPPRALLDQILHVFRAIIALHAASPALAKVFVKELPFVGDDRHGMADFMTSLYARLEQLIDRAALAGELKPGLPAAALAHNIFAIYFQALQRWLSAKSPSTAFHEAALRDSIELQLCGLRNRSVKSAKGIGAATRSRRSAKFSPISQGATN